MVALNLPPPYNVPYSSCWQRGAVDPGLPLPGQPRPQRSLSRLSLLSAHRLFPCTAKVPSLHHPRNRRCLTPLSILAACAIHPSHEEGTQKHPVCAHTLFLQIELPWHFIAPLFPQQPVSPSLLQDPGITIGLCHPTAYGHEEQHRALKNTGVISCCCENGLLLLPSVPSL